MMCDTIVLNFFVLNLFLRHVVSIVVDGRGFFFLCVLFFAGHYTFELYNNISLTIFISSTQSAALASKTLPTTIIFSQVLHIYA